MFKHIINDDIELKLPNELDAEELYKLIDNSREHLSRWLPWIKATNSIDTIASFIKGSQEQYVSNLGFKAIIMYKGSFAGLIGYHSIDWNRKSTSIGYWLGEEFQGKGIMTKALETLIQYTFNTLKLNKIEIQVAEENYKSKALPKKFGFKEEGIIRDAEWLNGKYVNHILFGLLKSEWKVSNH
ncbi:MAG: GNAT family protein [Bacillota bacterium]|nr:GNAT family protein [Bacillota bacterium]